jgi:hypothetical protein
MREGMSDELHASYHSGDVNAQSGAGVTHTTGAHHSSGHHLSTPPHHSSAASHSASTQHSAGTHNQLSPHQGAAASTSASAPSHANLAKKEVINARGTDATDINVNVTHELGSGMSETIDRGTNMLQQIANKKQGTIPTTSFMTDSSIDNYDYFKKKGIPLLYHGPNNSTAKILMHNTKYAILLTSSTGETTLFTLNDSSITQTVANSIFGTTSKNTIPEELENISFYDASGNVAKIFRAENGEYVIQVDQVNGVEVIYTTKNTYTYDTNQSRSFEIGESIGAAPSLSEVNSQANTLNANISNNNLSRGIPRNMIPNGEEDLYILKSQVVPPVCPRCPSVCTKEVKEQCPPCPACARCPEGSNNFTCKKVVDNSAPSNEPIAEISPDNAFDTEKNTTDDYSKYRHNTKFSPVPVVSSFSSF